MPQTSVTQRNFDALTTFIAEGLAASKPVRDGSLDGVNAHYQWQGIVRRFADKLEAERPARADFGRAAFLRAAGHPRADA